MPIRTITRKKSTITKITLPTRISTIMANMVTMNRMRSTLMAIPYSDTYTTRDPYRTRPARLVSAGRYQEHDFGLWGNDA